MNIRVSLIVTVVLGWSVACAATSPVTPTPSSTFTPVPMSMPMASSEPLSLSTPRSLVSSPTSSPVAIANATALPELAMLPAMVADNYAPPYVMACSGLQSLDQPFKLPWDKWDPAKLERVIKHQLWNNWTYYRCAQSVSDVTAFYRQWMPQPPYRWFEDSFEERPEGTLAIYNDSQVSAIAGYRWVYLMFIPDGSNAASSLMAVAWWNAPYTC